MPPAINIAVPSPISGPVLTRNSISVSAGAYTEIVQVDAPEEASAGDFVVVLVTVKNIHSEGIYIGVTGLCNSDELYSYPNYYPIEPEDVYPFAMSFTMPDHDVQVRVYSHYWLGADWYQDDETSIDIALSKWVKLATKTVTITPIVVPPPDVWVKLASRAITIIPTGYVPPPPPPEEEKKFPWAWVLIGGGGLIAIAGLASGRKK